MLCKRCASKKLGCVCCGKPICSSGFTACAKDAGLCSHHRFKMNLTCLSCGRKPIAKASRTKAKL